MSSSLNLKRAQAEQTLAWTEIFHHIKEMKVINEMTNCLMGFVSCNCYKKKDRKMVIRLWKNVSESNPFNYPMLEIMSVMDNVASQAFGISECWYFDTTACSINDIVDEEDNLRFYIRDDRLSPDISTIEVAIWMYEARVKTVIHQCIELCIKYAPEKQKDLKRAIRYYQNWYKKLSIAHGRSRDLPDIQ